MKTVHCYDRPEINSDRSPDFVDALMTKPLQLCPQS